MKVLKGNKSIEGHSEIFIPILNYTQTQPKDLTGHSFSDYEATDLRYLINWSLETADNLQVQVLSSYEEYVYSQKEIYLISSVYLKYKECDGIESGFCNVGYNAGLFVINKYSNMITFNYTIDIFEEKT